jgi:hypothetical protein
LNSTDLFQCSTIAGRIAARNGGPLGDGVGRHEESYSSTNRSACVSAAAMSSGAVFSRLRVVASSESGRAENARNAVSRLRVS